MEENISPPTCVIEDVALPSTSNRTGRPRKDFDSSKKRTKKRRIQHVLETSRPEEISMVTEAQLRREGKRDSVAIVKELCLSSPKIGTSIKKVRKRFESIRNFGLSADQALTLMIDANLTTHQYNVIRQQAKKCWQQAVFTT